MKSEYVQTERNLDDKGTVVKTEVDVFKELGLNKFQIQVPTYVHNSCILNTFA